MVLVSTVAEAAIAPAMISACTKRLCARASIRPARNCERYRMLATSASRPAMLSETMRRVRLEKLRAKKNCPARRSHPSGCHPAAGGFSAARLSMTTGAVSSALRLASGCVRSSNGQNRRLFQMGCPRCPIAFAYYLKPGGRVSRQTAYDPPIPQASLKRYPTPYRVSIISNSSSTTLNFFRSRLMWLSMVRSST